MKKAIICFVSAVLLTGCWDQRMIKDARLVYSSGFDLTDDGKIIATTSIRGFTAGGEAGGGVPHNEIARATGYNLRNTRMNIDTKISNTFTAAKNRVFLYSDAIAKEGLYPYLDIFYRDPSSSLNSKIAVAKGNAGRIIELNRKEMTLIGEYLEELIKSSEQNTIVPVLDVQTVCPLFFDPGKDPYLPFITFNEETEEVKVEGVALFNDDKMTGTLNTEDSTILLLLHDRENKLTRIVRKVNESEVQEIENYATIHVSKSKSEMKVKPHTDGSVSTTFDVKMKVSLIEYPLDDLTPGEIKRLNKVLSKILTEDANRVLEKLKEANSDPFGIGLELKAFHPKTWKNLDWKEAYPEMETNAKVSVEITSHGIIN